jgi:aspartyl-tRNA(Asn)/glutamyl-tRNA(Gln) amidotransferase subunit C
VSLVTHDELIKIAGLAKLSLEGEDVHALMADVADIMALAKSIDDADLSGLDCSVAPEYSTLRGDDVLPSTPNDAILSNAPDRRGGFFAGPAGRTMP